jgi:ABC-2 type transport system permease protein
MWSSFVAIFQKEFVHLRRDRSTLGIALMLPLFQLVLFGFIDQNVKNLPTTIVDQDHSRVSRELIDKLRATATFNIVTVTSAANRGREEIRAGRSRVAIVIPPDFHDDRAHGRKARVLVLIDGSDSTASAQALAAVNGLMAQENLVIFGNGQATEPAVGAQPIILFNPAGRTANYIIPGLVAILLQIVAVILTSLALVRERERGTLEQLLVTPINPTGLMLGKLAPYLVVGIIEMALVLTAMRWGFSVPIQGSLIFLFAMALVYLFAILAMGLFISTRAQTQAAAMQAGQMLLLPSIFLSGYIFPASGLPLVLYWIGRCLPATHMIAIMRGVVLRNAGPMDLLPNVAALIGMSVLLVWLSIRRFSKVSV